MMPCTRRSNGHAPWRSLLGAGVLLLLSACVVARGHSPAQPPIRLYAETGFQLQRSPLDSAPGSVACTVVRVRATIQAIRSDTLLLTDLETLTRPSGAAPCPDLKTAMVVTSSFLDLQAETAKVDGSGTALASVFLLPFIAVGTLVLGVLAFVVIF